MVLIAERKPRLQTNWSRSPIGIPDKFVGKEKSYNRSEAADDRKYSKLNHQGYGTAGDSSQYKGVKPFFEEADEASTESDVSIKLLDIIQNLLLENKQLKRQVRQYQSYEAAADANHYNGYGICGNYSQYKGYQASTDYNYQGHGTGEGYGAGGKHFQYKGYGASRRKMSIQNENLKPCRYCTEVHIWGHKNCPAFGKRCTKCMKFNHNAKACLSRTENRQISENELTGTVRKDYRHEAEVGAKSQIHKKMERSKSIPRFERENIAENKSEAVDDTETSDEAERCSSEESKNVKTTKAQKRKERRKRCARKYVSESESKIGSEQDENTVDEKTSNNLEKNEDSDENIILTIKSKSSCANNTTGRKVCNTNSRETSRIENTDMIKEKVKVETEVEDSFESSEEEMKKAVILETKQEAEYYEKGSEYYEQLRKHFEKVLAEDWFAESEDENEDVEKKETNPQEKGCNDILS